MSTIPFDYDVWIGTFPQFAVNPGQTAVVNFILPFAQTYAWREIQSGVGCVAMDGAIQANLLNLMVAHITQLLYGPNGTTPSGLVGRISQATEGSVSLSTEWPVTQANAWYLQTPFGAMYWQMLQPYFLGGVYVPGPNPGPFGPSSAYGWGFPRPYGRRYGY